MRKVIGILLMVICVAVYLISMRGKVQSDKVNHGGEAATSVSSEKKIAQIEKKIDTAYPDKPTEVIAIHNELMKIFYGNMSTSESLEDYARTIRKIYSTELQSLNSLETQIQDLEAEKEYIDATDITLVASEVKEVYVLKDEKGKETKAEVNVMHTTNQGSVNRTYFLVNEDGVWKINAWENQEAVNTSNTESTSSVEEIKSEE